MAEEMWKVNVNLSAAACTMCTSSLLCSSVYGFIFMTVFETVVIIMMS